MTLESAGEAKILRPDEGKSFWQPVPANGFVRNLFSNKSITSNNNFSIGTQTVAPRSFIREHTHDHNEEIIFVVRGKGICRLDGVEHVIEEGSCVFLGHNRKHHFLNPHDEPMTFFWIFMPGDSTTFSNRSDGRNTRVSPPRSLFRGRKTSRRSRRGLYLAGRTPVSIRKNKRILMACFTTEIGKLDRVVALWCCKSW